MQKLINTECSKTVLHYYHGATIHKTSMFMRYLFQSKLVFVLLKKSDKILEAIIETTVSEV